MKSEIHYLKGDATNPVGEGSKILVHIAKDWELTFPTIPIF